MKKESVSAFLVGFLFAIGLGISGMTRASKVVGFLDLFGAWDPSLLFVMIGAITVHFFSYRLIRQRSTPLLTSQWHIPSKREITPALVAGAFIFGVGWGISGYCPGPALTALASFDIKPWLFVSAMLAGMYLVKWLDRRVTISKSSSRS